MKLTTVISFFILLVISCTCHDDCEEISVEDCIATALKKGNFDHYHGQELACKTYLSLYILNEQKFFMRGNACANMIFSLVDCEGNEFCEPVTSECTAYFSEHAVNKGIVGIAKE